MLTLEQYKSSEMNDLYQKVLGSEPLDHIENLFREIAKKQEKPLPSPHVLAIEFYSPFICCSVCRMEQILKKKRGNCPNLYEAYRRFLSKIFFIKIQNRRVFFYRKKGSIGSQQIKEKNWQKYLESSDFKQLLLPNTLLLKILYW